MMFNKSKLQCDKNWYVWLLFLIITTLYFSREGSYLEETFSGMLLFCDGLERYRWKRYAAEVISLPFCNPLYREKECSSTDSNRVLVMASSAGALMMAFTAGNSAYIPDRRWRYWDKHFLFLFLLEKLKKCLTYRKKTRLCSGVNCVSIYARERYMR